MPRRQILLAALCFGTTGTAQALGPAAASALTVGAVRVAVGAALLLLAVRLVGSGSTVRLARWPLAVAGLGWRDTSCVSLRRFTTPAGALALAAPRL